jgi:hypothetical protein
MSKQLLEGPDLIKRAKELGVVIDTGKESGVKFDDGEETMQRAPEYEIQRRVLEAERHVRDGRLWIVALVSAAASLVSAIGAWISAAKGIP